MALVLLALLLFAHPVSAGCASHQDCCGGNNCECLISSNQCNASVSQSVPVQAETLASLPGTAIIIRAAAKPVFEAAPEEISHYFYLTSINNHPPTGPPLI
jgi:hypothetical protein